MHYSPPVSTPLSLGFIASWGSEPSASAEPPVSSLADALTTEYRRGPVVIYCRATPIPVDRREVTVSLRDELETHSTGYTSKTQVWLDAKPQDFRTEFIELVHDRTVGHSQLGRIAHKYGCPSSQAAFADWRRKQWASKTS